MFHTGIFFGTSSLGDLTVGQLAFITEGLDRHFKEQNKAMKRKR